MEMHENKSKYQILIYGGAIFLFLSLSTLFSTDVELTNLLGKFKSPNHFNYYFIIMTDIKFQELSAAFVIAYIIKTMGILVVIGIVSLILRKLLVLNNNRGKGASTLAVTGIILLVIMRGLNLVNAMRFMTRDYSLLKGIAGSDKVGFKHVIALLSNPQFINYFTEIAKLNISVIMASFLIVLLMGFSFTGLRKKNIAIIAFISMIPVLMPMQVSEMIVYLVFGSSLKASAMYFMANLLRYSGVGIALFGGLFYWRGEEPVKRHIGHRLVPVLYIIIVAYLLFRYILFEYVPGGEIVKDNLVRYGFISLVIGSISCIVGLLFSYALVKQNRPKIIFLIVLLLTLHISPVAGLHSYTIFRALFGEKIFPLYLITYGVDPVIILLLFFIGALKTRYDNSQEGAKQGLWSYLKLMSLPTILLGGYQVSRIWQSTKLPLLYVSALDKIHPWTSIWEELRVSTDLYSGILYYGFIPIIFWVIIGIMILIASPKRKVTMNLHKIDEEADENK